MMGIHSMLGYYEYHSMFHVGQDEYDVYGAYFDKKTPEYFDVYNREGDCLNEGSPIYAEDPEMGPTIDQLIRFT
jgi:hypothetical protein